MALLRPQAAFRIVRSAGLAVALPVLLTGCGETSGGQSLSAAPALFSLPTTTSSGLSLGSAVGAPSTGGGVPGAGAPGTNGSGNSSVSGTGGGNGPQRFGARKPIPITFLPSAPAPAEPQPRPTDSVPGPLPVLGAAAAFGCSRRLRRRLRQGS